jgi:hypothetical protein
VAEVDFPAAVVDREAVAAVVPEVAEVAEALMPAVVAAEATGN